MLPAIATRIARHAAISLSVFLIVAVIVLGGMLWLGGPSTPPVNQHLAARDGDIAAGLAGLPPAESLAARDGTPLSYRRYAGQPGGGLAVLVHGSSGTNSAVHALALALQQAGVTSIAVDVRGHGASGTRGDIAYSDQLDDDMADLSAMIDKGWPAERHLLVGHSSGGGFALRIAGSERGCEFDGYVALSPYLNYQASTNRPDGGWSRAGMPRIIALAILNSVGIHVFDALPVVNFAIAPGAPNRTYTYSWRLMNAFGLSPTRWENSIRGIKQPTAILIGADDDLFFADRMPGVIAALNPAIPVQLTPGVDHMGMVLAPAAISDVVAEVRRVLTAPATPRC